MKKMISGYFVWLALALAPLSAHAGLLLEPYLGYQWAAQVATASGADFGGKDTSTELGLRAGYKFPVMLWVAADYNMAMGGKFSAGNTAVLPDSDFDMTHLYADVGIDLPFLFRFWAGYAISQNYKLKGTNGSADTTFTGGSGYKLGAGFTGLPFVSINLEYFSDSPDTYNDGTDHSVSSVFSDYKSSGVLLSVSIPFNL